nr:galactoside 2-alpha-L-fucosyltransferase 2-like [Chelonoidis abingdonii]
MESRTRGQDNVLQAARSQRRFVLSQRGKWRGRGEWGDYGWVMPEIWVGVVADKAYLEKAMGYFWAKYQEPVFVVTSNGMQWCWENIDASRGNMYFSGDGKELSPGRDFALLVHCNHTIMTIRTFGIWAGYLAGGETVYLANYTLPDSPFLKIFKPEASDTGLRCAYKQDITFSQSSPF